MVGQVVAYVRVSCADQNSDRQTQVLGDCDRVFTDRFSGRSRVKRRGVAELMRYVRTGDTVWVASMDRLGRDTRNLYDLVARTHEQGRHKH